MGPEDAAEVVGAADVVGSRGAEVVVLEGTGEADERTTKDKYRYQ